MSAPVQLPVTLDRANRKKDRSCTVSFTTNRELTTDEFMELDKRAQESGWMLFAANELQPEDIPTHDADAPEQRSKGQRMRAVWFLKWKKRGIEEPFESWFTRQFETWMERWREELD